jgi:F-type H+-transporting ATPase subunit b
VNINETLIGQMITFALLVWFTMRFIWPPLDKTMQARRETIAEGLAAAERGHKELELAKALAADVIRDAKIKAETNIDRARKEAAVIVEEARVEANRQRESIIEMGNAEVEQERRAAEEKLKKDLVNLVILGTEKLLKRNIDNTDQTTLLDLGTKT